MLIRNGISDAKIDKHCTRNDFCSNFTWHFGACQEPLLLSSLQLPLDPSLKDKAIGVIASFVRVAQPVILNSANNGKKFFILYLSIN